MKIQGKTMSESLRVLLVEDMSLDAELIEREVRQHIPEIQFLRVDARDAYLDALESFQPDVILSDYKLPSFDGLSALTLAKTHTDEVPFILVTGSINEATAVECMKAGAWDYVIKEQLSRVGPGILNCLERRRLQLENIRAEKALLESEAWFRTLADSTATAIFISQGDYLVYVNKASCVLSGYSQAELLEKQFLQIVHPDFQELLDARNHARTRGESVPNRYEFKILCKDGSERWLDFTAGSIDWRGTPAMLGTAIDITEQKKNESERNHLAMAIEQAAESVVVTDCGGIIQYVNPAFETVTGYSRKEAVGQNTGILKSGKQDAEFYRQLWKTISSGKTWKGMLVNRRKNGELYTEETSISPVLDASGRIVSYVAVKKDVTAELEKEKEFQQVQKMESIGLLAGGVAHDFNNKLQIILGYAEMALDVVDPGSEVHGDLVEISKAAKDSADLTRQLLAFARRQTIVPRILDLNVVIENMLKMLRRLIGEDINLIWNPAGDLWQVRMDPTQVDQILANLCVNARDAIDGVCGSIIIETKNIVLDNVNDAGNIGIEEEQYLMLSISDNGCGMEQELRTHIFEPFFTSKGPDLGTGLGLATVYGIVKQNNGIIKVDSAPDKGSSFRIYLPRCTDEMDETPKDTEKAPVMHGRETILLVEDAPKLLGLTQKQLERLGYTVLAADRPTKALQLVQEYAGRIHILVTDVIMPEANGPELAAQLQSQDPNLKCLFMSGYTADAIGFNNVLPENIHFIQKPFEIEDLAAKLRTVLEETGN
jgi:PAS domain S-box-containing protein